MPKESSDIKLAGMALLKKSSIPLYTQLYQQVREMISQQRLRPGDRLPASRTLAKELNVSRVIISRAFEQLMMEGYVVGKTGSGTFVAVTLPEHQLNAASNGRSLGTKKQKAATASTIDCIPVGGKNNIIPFRGGAPSLDFFPYKIWQQVTNNVLKEFKQFHLGYEDTLGYEPLRTEIASYLRLSRAVKCEMDQVVIVTGSQQALNLISSFLLKGNDEVLMEDPGYGGARMAFMNAKANVCPVPVQKDGIHITYGKKHFSNPKLLYLTPSHQYPLGYTLSQPKRVEILKWAEQKKFWIIEDDYDSEFRYEGRPLPSLQGMDTNQRVVYSGTFSKVLFPGLRLAYIVFPNSSMANQFRRIKENLDRQSPIMEQLIVTKFMKEGYFLRHIRKMRLLYAERQQLLIKFLNELLGDLITIDPVMSGMQLVCRLSREIDIKRLRLEIEKSGLAISFIEDETIKHHVPAAISLGFTAFSKYKLRMGVQKLAAAVQAASL